MTRFARASGSKASNEREPEEATPWHVMKNDIVNKSNGKPEEMDEGFSYKKYLEEEAEKASSQWAEFSDEDGDNKLKKNNKKNSKKQKKNQSVNTIDVLSKVKNQKGKLHGETSVIEENLNNVQYENKPTKNKRKKKTGEKVIEKFEEKIEKSVGCIEENTKRVTTDEEPLKKKKKTKSKEKSNLNKNDSNTLKCGEITANNSIKSIEKVPKKKKKNLDNQVIEKDNLVNSSNENGKIPQKSIKKKLTNKIGKSGKITKPNHKQNPMRRKPVTEECIIGGKSMTLMYIDGFPVKKEDGERLLKLRKDLTKKGIPRSEIEKAMKLERRRAEKALAREKKKRCFNCRGAGHVLSECPNVVQDLVDTAASGICFKCGSTEHTHFECRVVKSDSYKFAQCFICKEQGHISRQCPDNPKGLYPQGGGCNVCGDVTHLKKDCPQYVNEQEEHRIYADTIDNVNVESISDSRFKLNNEKNVKKQKHIKF